MNKLTPHHQGILALSLSIASCVVAMIPNLAIPGLVAGVAGIVLAARLNRTNPSRISNAALMLGIVGIIMCALMLVIAMALTSFTQSLQDAGAVVPETAAQAS